MGRVGGPTDLPVRPPPGDGRRSTLGALLKWTVGVFLIVAAVTVVLVQREPLERAWMSARSAPMWVVAAVVVMPLTSLALTTTVFWILTRRFGRVGWWEMCGLIGSAWLLNMLPMKPGLIGRVAYHRVISGIPVTHSLLVLVLATLAGSVAIILTLAAVALGMPVDRQTGLRWLVVLGAGGVAVAALVAAGRMLRAQQITVASGLIRELGLCVLLRVLDTLLWALRYMLAFELIGEPTDFATCVIFAGVSQIAGQMPVQLGLREWTVGIASSVFRRGQDAGPGAAGGVLPGLQADLVTRAAEIVCAIPVGLLSYVWLSRRLHAAKEHGGAP